MDELLRQTSQPSLLAAVTTVHISLLLLRMFRNPPRARYMLLLLPCVALAATPWFFPVPAALILGLVVHVAWFVVVERTVATAPQPAAKPVSTSARRASVPRPSAPQPAPAAPRAAAPGGFVPAPVLAVFQETPDIRTFRLARPEGFDFRAGQFVTVRVNVDGKPVVRCYSISSAPEATGYLEITVKRQGLMSGMLHATVRPGSLLHLKSPAGGFVYPANDDRPVALLGAGVGITPLMSMLRHAVLADPTRPVTLLYSVRTPCDLAFSDELRWFAGRHRHVKIRATVTSGPRPTELLAGRIDRQMVLDQIPDPANTVFLVCGPAAMIEAMTNLLAALGVPRSQVRSEAFEAAVASTQASYAPPPAQQQVALSSAHTIRLTASGRSLPACAGRTLLESCEAAGVDLPAACRAGVCGTCRTRLVSGEVDCQSDLLGEGDRANGFILPCVSVPMGDCALEA